MSSEVLFLNHSSILIKKNGQYLLTDPWHQKPAFGSWLPTFPQYIHPSYIASLGERLTILISHGHDDHCDDQLLEIFSKDTHIVVAKFDAPSVVGRLRRLGFNNVFEVDSEGVTFRNEFEIKSFVNPSRSLDDAIFTINTGDGLVIHCNDNWFEFDLFSFQNILKDCQKYPPESVLFFSQTNSASGYPMNYRNFSLEEKEQVLFKKVKGMIKQGLKNAVSLGLKSFFSYAGYASIFVKGKDEYLNQGLVPTPKFIYEAVSHDGEFLELLEKIHIVDFYPGDVINIKEGYVKKAFLSSNDYKDEALKSAVLKYYENYSIIDNCDTFLNTHEESFMAEKCDFFLKSLNDFVVKKVSSSAVPFNSILGKSFDLIVPDAGYAKGLLFGSGLVEASKEPNKRLIVNAHLMNRVLNGEILFENLYTGYEGEWERFPKEVYNRDIVMFIVMYSYVYKNRLHKEFKP